MTSTIERRPLIERLQQLRGTAVVTYIASTSRPNTPQWLWVDAGRTLSLIRAGRVEESHR